MKLGFKTLAVATFLTVGTASAWAQVYTVKSGETKDYHGASVGTSCKEQNESQAPVILVKDNGILKNVTIKAGQSADGVHCEGTCQLINVKWPDVCEDAATMKGGSGKTMTIDGGSASAAADKIIQHNGVGSTVNIKNFTVNGTNGKLYRSCGDCSTQGKRTVNISGVTVNGTLKSGMAAINPNYGDIATITHIKWKGWSANSTSTSNAACVAYKGVTRGDSTKIGPQWDTANCKVKKSDITAF